jgi:hypothetical protein
MSGDFPREPVPAADANRSAATISFVVINAVIGIPIMLLGDRSDAISHLESSRWSSVSDAR